MTNGNVGKLSRESLHRSYSIGIKRIFSFMAVPQNQLVCGILKGEIKVVSLIPYHVRCKDLKEVYCNFFTTLFRHDVLVSLWF